MDFLQSPGGMQPPQIQHQIAPMLTSDQLQAINAQYLQIPGNSYIQSQPMPYTKSYQSTQYTQPSQFNPYNWKIVTHKRGRNSQNETEKVAKQSKGNEYWLDASSSNRYSALENETGKDNEDTSPKEKTPKPPPIFVNGVKNITPLVKLLDGVAKLQYEIKALADNQVKVQPKTTESYRTIVKALNDKNTEFHTYKLKEERSYKVVLKNMHHSINCEDIKAEIEKLGHTVTNVCNIKQYSTKLPLPMFFVELKPASNNKDIYNVEYLQQCKIKFEPPKHKRDIVQCAKCQRYGHTKNFCYQKPRCVKCLGDHTTGECSRKTKSKDVRCVLCGGNHPANYKGCLVYKELQKKQFPALRPKQYTPPQQIRQFQQIQPGLTYASATHEQKQQVYSPTNISQNPNQPHQQSSDMQELKNMMKGLFEQIGTMLNLLTTVIAKLK